LIIRAACPPALGLTKIFPFPALDPIVILPDPDLSVRAPLLIAFPIIIFVSPVPAGVPSPIWIVLVVPVKVAPVPIFITFAPVPVPNAIVWIVEPVSPIVIVLALALVPTLIPAVPS